MSPWGWFNIKIYYHYGDSHDKDETVMRWSYLYNGNPKAVEIISFYWINLLVVGILSCFKWVNESNWQYVSIVWDNGLALSRWQAIFWTNADPVHRQWASCQIRKFAGAHAPGMPGTFSLSPQVSDPDMHHGTCVTHVPWCMPGSLTSGFLWNRRRGKTFPAFPAHAQPAILRIW